MGRRIYACKDNYTINTDVQENGGSAGTLVLQALHCRKAGVIGLCL